MTKQEIDLEENVTSGTQEENYFLRFQVPEKLHKRIKKSLSLRKALGIPDYTLRNWLTKAVLRKHELDKLSISVPKQLQMTVELPVKIEEEINKKIDFYKKLTKSTYSKKKWILEAIEDQLEADEVDLQRKYRETIEN